MKSRKAWVISICVAAIVGLLVLTITSESFEKCEHDRKNHHAYEALHEKGSLLIKTIVRLGLHAACARHTASANDGAITALSGIAVALFTLFLWKSTVQLTAAGERQIAIAHRQSIIMQHQSDLNYIVNRAFVTVADFQYMKIMQTDSPPPITPMTIIVVFKNSGQSPTRDLFIRINFAVFPRVEEGRRAGGNFAGHAIAGCLDKTPQDLDYIDIPHERYIRGPDDAKIKPTRVILGANSEVKMNPLFASREMLVACSYRFARAFIWGWAEYDDEFPVDEHHRTEFCYEIIVFEINPTNAEFALIMVPFGDFNGTDKKPYRKQLHT